jgi:hypothetical protein
MKDDYSNSMCNSNDIGCAINTRCKKMRKPSSSDFSRVLSNELQCITVFFRYPEFATKNILQNRHCDFKTELCVDIYFVLEMYWNKHSRLPDTVEQFEEQMEKHGGLFNHTDKPCIIRTVSAILDRNPDGTWVNDSLIWKSSLNKEN